MRLPKSAPLLAAILFIPLVALAIQFLASFSAASPFALTKTYSNPAWGFALKMPADFSAYPPNATPRRDANGALTGQAIVLQNKSGTAVQIEITPYPEHSDTNVLTANDIEQLVPYYDLSNAQPVDIALGVTGTTFTHELSQPAPISADVLMFTYRGNLYELTAPTKDRALFEAMMETWTFL